MKDMIPKGTGNSRYLRSVNDFKTLYPTYDDFVNALVAGTLPVDFNGINEAGIQQVGTALNKATLLTDETAAALGLTSDDPTVDEAFEQLSTPQAGTGALYVCCKDEAGEPVSGCVVQIGEELAVTGASGAVKYFLAPGTYSVSIRSPIDYGAEAQTLSVTVPVSQVVGVDVTIADKSDGTNAVEYTDSIVAAFSGRVTKVDAFGVGGGGGGGAAVNVNDTVIYRNTAAIGGAGGYTDTALDLDKSNILQIVVGSGGVGHTLTTETTSAGTKGGDTSITTPDGTVILSAPGGEGGKAVSSASAVGANGGSGSGAVNSSIAGNSGSDGGNGEGDDSTAGGTGQGTNTRAFGESDGELFSSAGASCGGSTSVGRIGTAGPGAGAAAYNYIDYDAAISAIAEDATTPGSGGGAASIAIYLRSQSAGITCTSGSGAAGLVRFRWEVSA